MSTIKQRRLRLPPLVACHPPSTFVGDDAPFYFCPRSIMLFVIHRKNHPDLLYRGGQEPIVHLEADLHEVIAWAEAEPKTLGVQPVERRRGVYVVSSRRGSIPWANSTGKRSLRRTSATQR